MPVERHKSPLSRRNFLKLSGAAAGAFILGQFLPTPNADAARKTGQAVIDSAPLPASHVVELDLTQPTTVESLFAVLEPYSQNTHPEISDADKKKFIDGLAIHPDLKNYFLANLKYFTPVTVKNIDPFTGDFSQRYVNYLVIDNQVLFDDTAHQMAVQLGIDTNNPSSYDNWKHIHWSEIYDIQSDKIQKIAAEILEIHAGTGEPILTEWATGNKLSPFATLASESKKWPVGTQPLMFACDPFIDQNAYPEYNKPEFKALVQATQDFGVALFNKVNPLTIEYSANLIRFMFPSPFDIKRFVTNALTKAADNWENCPPTRIVSVFDPKLYLDNYTVDYRYKFETGGDKNVHPDNVTMKAQMAATGYIEKFTNTRIPGEIDKLVADYNAVYGTHFEVDVRFLTMKEIETAPENDMTDFDEFRTDLGSLISRYSPDQETQPSAYAEAIMPCLVIKRKDESKSRQKRQIERFLKQGEPVAIPVVIATGIIAVIAAAIKLRMRGNVKEIA